MHLCTRNVFKAFMLMSVLQPLSCGQTESKVCLPSHVLISHKVDAPCNLYVKQHVLDTRYHAFTDVPETKKNTHFGSYLEEAAKAHERAYIYQASQAQNNLAPVCRRFEEAFVDTLTVPQSYLTYLLELYSDSIAGNCLVPDIQDTNLSS